MRLIAAVIEMRFDEVEKNIHSFLLDLENKSHLTLELLKREKIEVTTVLLTKVTESMEENSITLSRYYPSLIRFIEISL